MAIQETKLGNLETISKLPLEDQEFVLSQARRELSQEFDQVIGQTLLTPNALTKDGNDIKPEIKKELTALLLASKLFTQHEADAIIQNRLALRKIVVPRTGPRPSFLRKLFPVPRPPATADRQTTPAQPQTRSSPNLPGAIEVQPESTLRESMFQRLYGR